MRIYLSHPYGGSKENKKLARRIAKWHRKTWEHEGRDFELVNPLDDLGGQREGNTEDQMLALAVDLMRSCDMVLFAPGWKKSRGCRYEHYIAYAEGMAYGHIPDELVPLFTAA